MVGHSEAVNVEFHEPLDEDEARDLLREAPGIMVIDKRDATGYMTPKEAQGEFAVYVSRIRRDPTVEHGLSMWVVTDNLRKGAALNAVQIAELLHERGLIGRKVSGVIFPPRRLAAIPAGRSSSALDATPSGAPCPPCSSSWAAPAPRLWKSWASGPCGRPPGPSCWSLPRGRAARRAASSRGPAPGSSGPVGLLIGSGWAVYVWAVTHGHNLESSLGYYITPLLNMAVGMVVFRERVDSVGAAAIALAVVGSSCRPSLWAIRPLIALFLACTFWGYGIIRKHVGRRTPRRASSWNAC